MPVDVEPCGGGNIIRFDEWRELTPELAELIGLPGYTGVDYGSGDRTAVVCASVDRERGLVTYRPAEPCERVWPLQSCERQARARRRQRLKRDSGQPPA